jgi:hypothetical protein
MQTNFSISAAIPAGLVVESTIEEGDSTLVRARSVAGTAACPFGGPRQDVSIADMNAPRL